MVFSDEVDDVNDIFPKLSYYLQLASNSALKGAAAQSKTAANDGSGTPVLEIKTSPPSSPLPDDEIITPVSIATIPVTSSATVVTTSTTKMILATPFSVPSSMIASSAASTLTTTSASSLTNKISLVPTNILMKPTVSTHSATPTQFSFKPQQFLCTKPGVGTTTANTGQMKYLLVNTLQKPPSTVTSVSSSTVSGVNTLSARSIVNIQPKIQVSAASLANAAPYQTRSATAIANAAANGTRPMPAKKYIYATAAPQLGGAESPGLDKRPPGTWKYSKSSPGFRTLLTQLVQLQNKTLDLSQQRLDVEKQRLDYERSTGDKILNVLTTLLQQRTNDDKPSPNDDKKNDK